MTKSEQKKIETEMKRDFIEKVYTTIIKGVPKMTRDKADSLDIRIIHKTHNRYISFLRYGQALKFKIYRDGNVGITLKEFCHDDYETQLFEYIPDKQLQEDFIKRLSKTMSWMLSIFLNREDLDFHSYMDFISNSNDIYEAYDKMQDEIKQWKKEKNKK